MIGFNISTLPKSDRIKVELERKASLLIHKLKRREISRADVIVETEKLPTESQDAFKSALNKFQEMK